MESLAVRTSRVVREMETHLDLRHTAVPHTLVQELLAVTKETATENEVLRGALQDGEELLDREREKIAELESRLAKGGAAPVPTQTADAGGGAA